MINNIDSKILKDVLPIIIHLIIAIVFLGLAIWFSKGCVNKENFKKKIIKNNEKFTVTNGPIPPEYLKNPPRIKSLSSSIKKNIYNSSANYDLDCDEECVLLKNKIHDRIIPDKIKAAESTPENYLYSFENNEFTNALKPSLSNEMTLPLPSSVNDSVKKENFNYKSKSANEYSNKNFVDCQRPQFIKPDRKKDAIDNWTKESIGRWTYTDDPNCKTMDINNNDSWTLKNLDKEDDSVFINEGFLSNKSINDSKIIPKRTLPEYLIMNSKPLKSNDYIKEDYDNRNNIIYTMTDESETAWNDETFNQKTKCCHKNNTALKDVQNLDEYDINDNIKLLSSITGMTFD